ncbi:MAG: hypothetical protein Q4D26_07755 [Clostridia bacterium]|nr:hypothetical protein [Clostridia bacterium]
MPIYVGDSTNKAKAVESIYVGNENNIAQRVLYAYVGDENNIAQLVYDGATRDFSNLDFKCTYVNEATGGTVSVNTVYTAIPIMWNTGAELNSSVTFKSSKLKLRKGDTVKITFTLSPPEGCSDYNINVWLESNAAKLNKSISNTSSGAITWDITSTLSPISFIINIYGSSANVKLTACNIYVNDTKIL